MRVRVRPRTRLRVFQLVVAVITTTAPSIQPYQTSLWQRLSSPFERSGQM